MTGGFETQFHFREGRFAFAEASMGTVFVFKGTSPFDETRTLEILDSALAVIHLTDSTFSLYKPGSPLSKLARGETSVAECPPEVAQIWEECEAWEKTTDGWFSAFTPEHTFDPSGLVKTWAARAAANVLLENYLVDFSMNAGGDIYVADAASEPDDWKVGLSKPVSIASAESGVLTVLDLLGTGYRAVATSGSAERGEHIWNPKFGGAAHELLQVSVVAKDLVAADVWATACFAGGTRTLALLDAQNRANPTDQVQALMVLPERDLAATQGFEALIAKR